MKIFLIALLILSGCKPCWHADSDDEIVACMADSPMRPLKGTRPKIFVSMTTSPKRLSKIHYVLRTLDWSLIDTAFLALPDKYKNKEPYGSTEHLKREFPKLRVIHRENDLGPIMKLLPAVEEVQTLGDPSAIVITIDDDTAYPKGMIAELVRTSIKRNAIVAGWGTSPGEFDINNWPEQTYSKPELNIVEGFAGVAYPVKYVNVKAMTEASKQGSNKVCFTSDDIVISWVLAREDILRLMKRNRYMPGVVQFQYGFEEDALSAGAGCEGEACGMAARYRLCVDALSKSKEPS